MPIHTIAQYRVKPSGVDKVKRAIEEFVPYVRANEPGTKLYQAWQQKDDPTRQFLHRGIAARQFQRSFLLADGVEVKDAVLEHGMLVISVERPKLERLARHITIRSA